MNITPSPWIEVAFDVRRLSMATDDLLWLYIGRPDRQRAQIVGRVVDARDLDLRDLEMDCGRQFHRACVVCTACVLDLDLLGKGHGVALYAALAELAASEFDAPIVSSHMAGYETSPDAARTWASRRLAKRVMVRGQRAWAGATATKETV